MTEILGGLGTAMTSVGAIFTNFFNAIGELFVADGGGLTTLGAILTSAAAIGLGSSLLALVINLFKRIGRR